jgi:hypothetical protein
MTSEIAQLPPYQGAQNLASESTPEKQSQFPQPQIYHDEGPQVDTSVPVSTIPASNAAAIAQQYKDQCQFRFLLCQQLF